MSSLSVDKARRRLSKPKDFAPWVLAEQMNDCHLFWLPVSGFPMRHEEKTWLTEFQSRLIARLEEKYDLRTEIFLQYKSLTDGLGDAFLKYRRQCLTLMGLGRKPGGTIPSLPTAAQLRMIAREEKAFDIDQWVGDYSYWFIMKQPERQRELFLGSGGLTTILLPPDPKTKAPRLPYTPALRAAHPAFQKFDVDAVHASTYAMGDEFLQKSKEMFGAGLEEEVQYEGLAFILPLLSSGHFFAVSSEMRAQWFELFDVYINESKPDKGVILAFAADFDTEVIDILASMEADELCYPR